MLVTGGRSGRGVCVCVCECVCGGAGFLLRFLPCVREPRPRAEWQGRAVERRRGTAPQWQDRAGGVTGDPSQVLAGLGF